MMRKSLRWALGATSALSVATLLWPSDGRGPAVVEAALLRPAAAAAAPAVGPLPNELPRTTLVAAQGDPFNSQALAPPPPPPVPLTLPPPVPVAPPVPPPAYRFLGAMTDPGGQRFVFLVKGDQEVSVQPGTQLDDGYQVVALTPTEVQLRHAASDTKASIAIPPSRETAP